MSIEKARTGAIGALAALMLFASAVTALQLSQADGDRFQRKLDEITKNASADPVRAKKTPATEIEVNSCLVFNLRKKIPRGLTEPQITMIGDGKLAGRVLVDLDEFKRHRNPQGFMDPLTYISGKVPIAARGVLRTREGKGQFQFESAEIYGVPLPKPVLQELVSFFSRTPEHPEGFDLDAPFNLPAKIREVVINKGEAVVVQ